MTFEVDPALAPYVRPVWELETARRPSVRRTAFVTWIIWIVTAAACVAAVRIVGSVDIGAAVVVIAVVGGWVEWKGISR